MSLRPISWIFDDSPTPKVYIDETFTADYSVLEDANDRWYVGFDRRFDALYLTLETGGSYTNLKIKYWNGETWKEFGLSYVLSESDFVRWNIKADVPDWERYAFTETEPHAATPPDTKDRYWLQISCTAVTTAAKVTSVEVAPYTLYATAKGVSEFLQQSVGEEFNTVTLPTESVVEDIIRRHESALERITRRSWRLAEAVDIREFNYAGIKLIHAPIRKLEQVRLWQGTSWRTLEQGRTGECYSVDDIGFIYFTRFFVPIFVPYSGGGAVMPFVYLYMLRYPVEVTYLYGEDFETHEDAGFVEHIVTLMTAKSLLQEYERSILTKAGVDRVEMSTRLRMWDDEIEKGLATLSRGLTIW